MDIDSQLPVVAFNISVPGGTFVNILIQVYYPGMCFSVNLAIEICA